MRKLFVVTAKKTCSVILCVSIILFTSSAIATTQKADNWLDEPISISFQNEALSRVLKKISEQTGVSIAYDQELSNEKVTGNYQDVKTSDAITRLFKSKNISIRVNPEKKIIIVKTFGAKNYIWANIDQDTNSAFLISSGAELDKLHYSQIKDYKERITNENEILDGGMTRAEIQSLHKAQYEEIQIRIENDNEILDGGMTRGEINILQKAQNKEIQERLKHDNEVLDGGMTRGEINILQKTQNKEIQERLKRDNEVLDGGMTRAEIRTLQKKQIRDYLKPENRHM